QRPARAHRSRARISNVRIAIVNMGWAKTLRHEQLDRFAEQLLTRVAKHPLRLRIDDDDFSARVDDDDSIRRRLEQTAKSRFRLSLRRNVANDADDQPAAAGVDRAETDLNREFATIVAASPEIAAEPHRSCARTVRVFDAIGDMMRAIAFG